MDRLLWYLLHCCCISLCRNMLMGLLHVKDTNWDPSFEKSSICVAMATHPISTCLFLAWFICILSFDHGILLEYWRLTFMDITVTKCHPRITHIIRFYIETPAAWSPLCSSPHLSTQSTILTLILSFITHHHLDQLTLDIFTWVLHTHLSVINKLAQTSQSRHLCLPLIFQHLHLDWFRIHFQPLGSREANQPSHPPGSLLDLLVMTQMTVIALMRYPSLLYGTGVIGRIRLYSLSLSGRGMPFYRMPGLEFAVEISSHFLLPFIWNPLGFRLILAQTSNMMVAFRYYICRISTRFKLQTDLLCKFPFMFSYVTSRLRAPFIGIWITWESLHKHSTCCGSVNSVIIKTCMFFSYWGSCG